MKKIVLGLGFVLCSITNAQTVQDLNLISPYSNNMNAGSARYIGMGGSMGALGGDISSVEQNPAGLGLAITSEASMTMAIPNYKNKSTFGNSYSSKESDFLINHFGASFVFNNGSSLWNRFAIGVKYAQESLDNHIGILGNDKVQFTDTETETTYKFAGYQDQISGYKSKFTLDFSTSYADRLYLGLGFSFHDVSYNNYVVFDENTNGVNYRYDLNGTPYSNQGSGISLSVGAIGKVNDNFRLGLAYHSPVWYSRIEEEFLANLPIRDSLFRYDWYYSEQDRTSNGKLVASAGVVLAKSLAFNLDYTYHMNGTTNVRPKRYFVETNQFLNDNLINSSEIRVGAEYRIDKFKIRAGYNYVQSPWDNFSIDADTGNGNPVRQSVSSAIQGDINRISFGLGYDFGGFTLDAAYQFQNQSYKYIFGNGDYVDYDNGTVYYASLPLLGYNYLADIKQNKGMFLLTGAWQF